MILEPSANIDTTIEALTSAVSSILWERGSHWADPHQPLPAAKAMSSSFHRPISGGRSGLDRHALATRAAHARSPGKKILEIEHF